MPDTAKAPATDALRITRSMRVAEIVTLFPAAADIMAEYGLHCFHCSIGGVETLDEGCGMHGMTEDMIDELVDDLNHGLAAAPARPLELTITLPASRAIQAIASQQGKENEGLSVIVDEHGGFCMEFRAEPAKDERIFFHAEAPEVRIFASTLTLQRIGGATIDFREERFKLDLPEDAESSCCGGNDGCACSAHAEKAPPEGEAL